MADAAVSFLLENLQQLVVREAELFIFVQDDIEWIQTEFRLMVANLELVEAQHQPSSNEVDWVKRTRTVIRRAEDLVETYAKRASQNKTAAIYKRPLYWKAQRHLIKELRRIKDEITQVRQEWRSVDLAYHVASSSDHHQHWGFSAMAKLDSALNVQYASTPQLARGIRWVRDELEPLHHFLQEIDGEQDIILQLGERQKIWIQELRAIFQFIDESFPRLHFQQRYLTASGEENGAKKWLFFFLNRCDSYSDESKLGKFMLEIRPKILHLYRRYCAYGFGEILLNNGRRSIFPRIRMNTPIPDISGRAIEASKGGFLMFLHSFFLPLPAAQIPIRMALSSWLTPVGGIESLRVDLKLMKALLEDTGSMRDLDKRVKVWLKQVQKISIDLEALDENANNTSQGRTGVFRHILNRMNTGRKLKHIRCEIRDIAARKMTYGIGSALGEGGSMLDSIAATSFEDQPYKLPVNHSILQRVPAFFQEPAINSKAKISRRVKSVKKELQLMQALVEDVSKMKKLDARLRFWVEQMQGIAREANTSVELDPQSLFSRIQATWRINQICNYILVMSKLKHTFDINVKSTRQAGILDLDHNIEETVTYPLDSITREIKLIEALESDVGEMDELDGKSEAWVGEMGKIAEDAKNHPYHGFDQVKDKISQLSQIRIAYGIQFRHRLPPNIVDQIKAELLADHEHSCIVPIFGMRNTHKEALQDLFNEDSTITHRFDWYAWVHVPEEVTASSISEYIAHQIVEQQRAMPFLQDALVHNRCLIVLDEIRTIEVWKNLKPDFQQISSGSRIILISNEQTRCFLNSTLNAIDVMPGSDASSTDHDQSVPSYLRQCVYYFLLFPANFEIPARRLIVLWVAEGLVHPKKNESDSVERVAYRYLLELIKLGKVRVTKESPNGEVKACKLSDDTRETWLKMAKEAGFFPDENDIISRLVDHHGGSDPCFIHINGNHINFSASAPNYQSVISFLSFNTQEGSKPGEDIGDFLRKCISAGCFQWMRVLDLERVFRPKLPKALSKLALLRYLGLRWTYLEHLPNYVSKFLNLQVLDVKHTYISILPKSIWRMEYLRHLYLSETYRTRFDGRPSDISLNDLQTLWGAFIDEDTCVAQGLDTLQNVRKLGLSCRPSSSSENSRMTAQLKAVDEWISKLKFLESLRLKSRDEDGEAEHLHLSSLENNTKLSTVYLLGKLDPPVVCKFPESLTDITLSGSELDMDPMQFLGKLPNLQILRLLAQSVKHYRMVCDENSFLKLKVLKIWKLEKLEKWEADYGSLPSLKELEIRSCEKLEKLPDQLQHVEQLQITLTTMPKEFIENTEARQPDLWAKVKHVPELD